MLALLDALQLSAGILAGYDCGGMSSCVVSALWPDRLSGLLTLGGYDVIDIGQQRLPHTPTVEHAVCYLHLFQTARGRAVLAGSCTGRRRMLWHQW